MGQVWDSDKSEAVALVGDTPDDSLGQVQTNLELLPAWGVGGWVGG